MGEIADDMINGACCSRCGIYFREEHEYPVLCKDCFGDCKGCNIEFIDGVNGEKVKLVDGCQKAIYDEI